MHALDSLELIGRMARSTRSRQWTLSHGPTTGTVERAGACDTDHARLQLPSCINLRVALGLGGHTHTPCADRV